MSKIIILTVAVLVPLVFNPVSVAELYMGGGPVSQGTASWYSQADPAVLRTTANMEIFDDTDLTCAIWDVPFNTRIKATNLSNGKSVIVRVNDRGPAKRLVKEGRIIDLSKKAFSEIADLNNGLIPIEIKIIPAE